MTNKQQTPNQKSIALFAGRGDLPRMLIQVFQSQERPFFVCAFNGQTDDQLVQGVPHAWFHFGEVSKALKALSDNNIQQIVMAGTMARPTLSSLRPDWIGVKWLAKLGKKALGDDNLLKALISLLEDEGYQVVAPHDVLTDLLAPQGCLTTSQPDEQALRDIGRGIEILTALETVDVGQATVIQEGLVLGIEAIEGTDALIDRSGNMRREGQGGVLVKFSKRQQEHRADLPVVGLETITRCAKAGLRGIAFEAGRALLLNQKQVIEFANKNGMFLVGLARNECQNND